MEKLTIKQASERFGLSKARLYQLLDKGAVAGHRSEKKGRGAGSWIDGVALKQHIQTRDERVGLGGPKAVAEGNYLPTGEAAKKIGVSIPYIHKLIKRGSVASKKSGRFNLVHWPSLSAYKNKLI